MRIETYVGFAPLRHGEACARSADEAGHAYSRISSSYALGLPYLRRGDFDHAIQELERGLAISREANLKTVGFHGVASFLGEAYVSAGRFADGIPLLEQVVKTAGGLGAHADYLLAPIPLSHAYLRTGRRDDAIELAGHALRLAQQHGYGGSEARALHFHGELYDQDECLDSESSERYYRQSLTRAVELEMRPLQAHCHLGLGKLCRQIGRLDEGQLELGAAVSMLREMGMTHWLPEAETELAQADGSVVGRLSVRPCGGPSSVPSVMPIRRSGAVRDRRSSRGEYRRCGRACGRWSGGWRRRLPARAPRRER